MTASISPVLVSKPRPESGNSGVVKLRQPIDLATKSIDSVGVVVVVVVVMQVRGKGRRCVCVCVSYKRIAKEQGLEASNMY